MNTGRVHFDLIRKKKNDLKEPTQSLLVSPEKVLDINKKNVHFDLNNDKSENIKYTEESQPENKEILDLKLELAESKKEIKSLKELICELCQDAKQGKLQMGKLQMETKESSSEPEKPCECNICGKIYSNKDNLRAHILQNHAKKFDCDSCEESFKTEQELKLHDEEDHTNHYDCEQCDHQSSSIALLKRHCELKHLTRSKTYTHSDTDPNIEYNCDQCSHQDTTKRSLDNHIKLKHKTLSMDCKGVGSKKCGEQFESYSDLMDHRRDHHNSGNKICRYFKEGTCFYMNSEKGGCWYLHIEATSMPINKNHNDSFPCTNCDNIFKSLNEVMKHRLQYHEEEVPECTSSKEGKKCEKNTRCWFRHLTNKEKESLKHVPLQNAPSHGNISTNNDNDQVFWPGLPNSNPPNQLEKMMEMLKVVMQEVSGLKLKLNQN